MIKLIILLLIVYFCRSECILSINSMCRKIPLKNITMMHELDIRFDYSTYIRGDEKIYRNVTEINTNIEYLNIEDMLIIAWTNITNMDHINPYFNVWSLYFNNIEIKPISVMMDQFVYVSYIENECGIDTYDINVYPIYHNPGSKWYVMKILLDGSRLFKAIKV